MPEKTEKIPEPTLFDALHEQLAPSNSQSAAPPLDDHPRQVPQLASANSQSAAPQASPAPADPAATEIVAASSLEAVPADHPIAVSQEPAAAEPAATLPVNSPSVTQPAAAEPAKPSPHVTGTATSPAGIAEAPFAAPPIRPRSGDPSPVAVPRPARTGGWWTIPLMCLGLSMIASAMILGQVESNRQLAWQRDKLKQDLDHLHRQIKVNDEFLKDIQKNPTLIERLAQRQTKEVRQGTAVLAVPSIAQKDDRNPFALVTIAPPQPLAPYAPRRSLLVWLCGTEQRRLLITALGLFCMAAGLILGGSEETKRKLPAA